MTKIAIEKANGCGSAPRSDTQNLETTAARIRQRAYDLFEHRGGEGSAFDDWLQAERDLIVTAQSDLVEKDGRYEIRVSVPGFRAREIHLTALPDAVVVFADSNHKHEDDGENVHFCEFGGKSIYRRFDLPKPLNVNLVTANLCDGVIRIIAQKAEDDVKPVNGAGAPTP